MPDNKPLVGIVDYGLGNLFSIERALKHIGARPVITDQGDSILSCSRIILPGVGAFPDAMRGLEERNLTAVIKEAVNRRIPLLGICLGMQLLMSRGEEFGDSLGFDFIKGKAVRFQEPKTREDYFKIPHIGWNSLRFPDKGKGSWEKTILEGLEEGAFMYFVHSYIVVPDDPSCVVAMTEYGEDKFCSVISSGNIAGCQFHPERSGEAGLSIYKRFVFN